MSQDRSALEIWHVVIVVTCSYSCLGESPRRHDSYDKIRHVLVVIYCSWTSNLAQPPKNLKPAVNGRSALHCRWKSPNTNGHSAQNIWSKRWLIHQNEANDQCFAFLRGLDHLGDWTPHSVKKTSVLAKNVFQTVCYVIFPDFRNKLMIIYSKSAYQTTSKNAGGKTLEQKNNNKIKQRSP